MSGPVNTLGGPPLWSIDFRVVDKDIISRRSTYRRWVRQRSVSPPLLAVCSRNGTSSPLLAVCSRGGQLEPSHGSSLCPCRCTREPPECKRLVARQREHVPNGLGCFCDCDCDIKKL